MANEIQQGLYGNAILVTDVQHDLTPEFSAEGSPAVVMGYHPANGSKGWAWNPATMQGHALSFGTTRSGKGTTAIIPALLAYAGSVVVIDPKGENCWTTSERRRKLGQRVVVLDPWNEVNRRYAGGQPVEPVTRFNPLSTLDPKSPDFPDDVTALADALIITGGSEPHWSESARELVKGLIAAVVERNPGKASPREIRLLLAADDKDLAGYIAYIQELNPESLGARLLRRFAKDSREVGSIRSVAETQTAFLDSKILLDAMETDETPFDLTELATGKISIYLVLPLDRLESHGRWLRLILTLAIRAISRQVTPPEIPVMFLLDEFGTIGALRMIETAFGLLRGLGVVVWAFLQDLSQLQRDYPNSWQTFMANTAVIQVLNARDNATSEYFSSMAGQYSAYAPPANKGAVPEKEVQRPLLLPDDIRRMPLDTNLLFYAGAQTVRTARTPYFKNPAWKGLYRPLPMFAEASSAPPSAPQQEPKRGGWFGGKR